MHALRSFRPRVGSVLLISLGLGLVWSAGFREASHAEAAENGASASLHDTMETLGGVFRDLRRAVRRPEDAAKALDLLQQMQTLALTGKTLVPKQLEQLASDARTSRLRAYRLRMITLLEKSLATERAVLEGRHDDAYELVKEIYTLQRDSHAEFRVED